MGRIRYSKDGRDRRSGWILEIGEGGPSFRLAGGANRRYISARPGQDFKLKTDNWYHVVFTYDGSRERAGLSLYVNGKFVPTIGSGEDIEAFEGSARTTSPLQLGKDKKSYFEDGAIAEFQILNRMVNEQDAALLSTWSAISAARAKDTAQLSDAEREVLNAYYLDKSDPTTRATSDKLRQVDAERQQIARRGATTLVMHERPDAKPMAHVLYRGQYDQPRDEVEPKVPAVLPRMPDSFRATGWAWRSGWSIPAIR